MRLLKQSFEILEQEIPVRKLDDSNESYKNRYLEYMYKHIEKCGRTCYKSENRITEDSALRFINGLIKSKHYSVLEHGAVYLQFPNEVGENSTSLNSDYLKYEKNPHSRCEWTAEDFCYVTTNYRVIVENGWEEDLQYLCEPTDFHEKRHTVLLHSCIHVYKDITRHRKMSFSIESTRYVNYSKTDRFGEMKFVLPPWIKHVTCETFDQSKVYYGFDDITSIEAGLEWKFINHLVDTEALYNLLTTKTDNSWQPQQAAEVLPQATAADVIMSGFASDWEFVFRLRSDIAETGQPHPLVEEIMTPLRDEFIKRNYINNLI